MHSAARRWTLHWGLLAISVVVATLLAEGLSRAVLNPVDYLAVDPVFDPVLGVRLEPNAGGHDEWGFRNPAVPESADVVTIGDSQTYGISAPAHLSWPGHLKNVTKRRVYNLALGGYGAMQYRELLRTRALQLHPAVIVVGFYYGNDLFDAYKAVYGLRHWAALRRKDIPEVGGSMLATSPRQVFLGSVRDWLARHSVVYRLASFTVLGSYARRVEFMTQHRASGVVPFQHPVNGVKTGFTPLLRLKALDLEDATIREGLRLSLDQLDLMAEECRVAGVHFMVALIPTKERVYAPWLVDRADLPERASFRALLNNEDKVNRLIQEWLDRSGIRYLDLVTPLRASAALQAIYPGNDDGHPNSEGYAVIARAVTVAIRDWLPTPSSGVIRH